MVKHARKKQKLSTSQEIQPLGSVPVLDDDAGKDEEERRLESILFGKPFKPSGKHLEADLLNLSDGEDVEETLGRGNEMEQLQDTDLFFIDDGALPVTNEPPEFAVDVDLSGEVQDNEDSDDQASRSGSPDEETEGDQGGVGEEKGGDIVELELSSSTKPLTKLRKPAAWADPDDSSLQVSLASNKRLRKLRDAPSESVVGGTQYEAKLRREYERIHPAPEWAAAARKKLHPKRRRSALDADDEEELEDAGSEINDLLTSTNGILSSEKSASLPKGNLAIERLRDANQSAKAEGEIKALAFHPSPKVPILLTASSDRRLRLFNVDGHTNPHLQTTHIPSLPMTNAVFHPSGSSILLTGPRPFYYTHDLQSGTTARSPRGLWSTTFSNTNAKLDDMSMEICAFDPSGEVLAIAGRRGYVHLVDWKSGAGQVVGSVKMNSTVKSLNWSRESGRTELMTLADDAEVYVWNVGERKCVRRWKDDGGYGSKIMDGDQGGRYLGIGSKTGLVNIYGSDAITSTTSANPKPLKTIGNLTTSISTLRFNHDSQLLAIASNYKKDQMRLIHLSSLTAFSNWPTSSTPLGHVTAIDFSAGSEYIAVGNNRGRVLLYHLPHFVVR